MSPCSGARCCSRRAPPVLLAAASRPHARWDLPRSTSKRKQQQLRMRGIAGICPAGGVWAPPSRRRILQQGEAASAGRGIWVSPGPRKCSRGNVVCLVPCSISPVTCRNRFGSAWFCFVSFFPKFDEDAVLADAKLDAFGPNLVGLIKRGAFFPPKH